MTSSAQDGAPRLRVTRADFFVTDCRTRLPFRFGVATITSAPLCTARVEVEVDGFGPSAGYSADLMVPRWFDKDPAKAPVDDLGALKDSVLAAGLAFRGAGTDTAFGLWRQAYRARVEERSGVRLVNGFGVALVERAMLDASCRAAGHSFFEAWKRGTFGFDPGAVHAELADWDVAASLPSAPSASITLRHTVGMADPLHALDVDAEHAVNDGLPEALEEDVRRFGLTCFKVKIGAGVDEDARRLAALAAFLPSAVASDYSLTLDANEQYPDLRALAALLDTVGATNEGARLVERIRFVEQPLPRAVSFDAAHLEGIERISERAPLILDEADHGIDAFPRALDLGYRGVSVKNCKGVFRAFLNRGLCDVRGGFQSAEDLTNLPVLALQQDLATHATLGLPDVERNGHHYFRGLDHLPASEVESALEHHADLYEARGDGAFLRIEEGKLALASLDGVGYGYSSSMAGFGATDGRVALDAWEPVA